MCESCRHDGAAGKARAADNEDLNYRKGRIRSAGPFLVRGDRDIHVHVFKDFVVCFTQALEC